MEQPSSVDFLAKSVLDEDESTIEIDVDESLVVIGENNARIKRSAKSIQRMAHTLQSEGQLVAAPGFWRDGKFVLLDGGTRLLALREAGLKRIRVAPRPDPNDPLIEYRLSRLFNTERSDMSALDDALRWQSLLENNPDLTQAALAETLGIKASTISRYLGVLKLPERILDAVIEMEEPVSIKWLCALREYYELTLSVSISDLVDEDVAAKNGKEFAANQVMGAATQEALDEVSDILGRHQNEAMSANELAATRNRLSKKIEAPASHERTKYDKRSFTGKLNGALKLAPDSGQVKLTVAFRGESGMSQALYNDILEVLERYDATEQSPQKV